MRVYGSIEVKRVLADPFLVTINELYFSKSTGRTKTNLLADKFIVPKNLRGTLGMHQHDTQVSGATKALYLMFGAEKTLVAGSQTGEPGTAHMTKYVSIQEKYFANMHKCKMLIIPEYHYAIIAMIV